MWVWATCSSLLAAIALCLLSSSGAQAEAFLTREQALAEAFPGAEKLDTASLFLTDEQAEKIEESARAKLETRVLSRITATKGVEVMGYAYFDTHIVRTMPETILVSINPDGTVHQVQILSFTEPDDYRPRPRWLTTIEGKKLSTELWPGRGVPKVTGASLTTQAITDAVRRILAIHAVTMEAPR